MNFKDKYSNLISQVASDNLGNFAALSSPTLSKQETVTGLFEIIKNAKPRKFLNRRLIFIALINFFPRLIYMFSRLIFISIFNGAFTELLMAEMPMIFFKQKLVLYWGSPDYQWGFTTMDNTAEYTAKTALQNASPRYLRIAGDLISPREVKNVVSEITGQHFRFFSPGGKKLLGAIIKIIRKLAPGEKELYPAWQGMQYMHNMIDERSNMETLDNNRFSDIQWTGVRDLLSNHMKNLNQQKT